jgi:hypothetical protein
MPLRNRVTPGGSLIGGPGRGLVYGNRGCLHNDEGEIYRNWRGRRWISCQLEFRGRHRDSVVPPGRYTSLFFLDDATAFAAGHRPCSECRHEDFVRYKEIVGARNAAAIDARLHLERLDFERTDFARGSLRSHEVDYGDIPDGAFVATGEGQFLVLGKELLRWTPQGYAYRRERPRRGVAQMITPPLTASVLTRGWNGLVPFLHPSALTPL